MTTFASDNYAPAHPDVLAALAAASAGHEISYGEDPWTARLQDVVRDRFGPDAAAYPVLTGTGANVVALMAMLPRWGAVVATEHAHLNTDENGAPERVGGVKVLTVPAPDGRLTPAAVERFAGDLGDPHRAQPLVVSLTQATELGTVYTPAEIRAVADAAHAHGMRVHLDGSRLANAAAALDVPLRALTTDAGVDVLSFGGTKNGLALGEAVIVLDPSAVDGVEFVRKATMQLASKMRYVSAQLLALFEPVGDPVADVDELSAADELWRRNARHANAMAARLRAGLEESAGSAGPGVAFTQPTQANAVFATLPRAVVQRLRERHRFYDWAPGETPDRVEVRWMCAWDTTVADVDEFAADVRGALAEIAPSAAR
ncbi:low specificity L-threonine aldolase [Cellulosimicrobium sp. CUA-896]|uniref:threonine aldolase family protein n=1 Tax=Cellulosimicrobium sp. CUA-896 TaxID=1517881 RepID=UPI000966B90F|nr:beta-eliminating lyase-related protein [Cellulosimicrobium sp. CUA-896]OLT53251.1 threonine aldolase [Cellulosimicrobium sp. CUA-896]